MGVNPTRDSRFDKLVMMEIEPEKVRHKWKVSLVVNIQKCVNCHGERRRDPKTGKYHYSTESKTYCEESDLELFGYEHF